MKKEGKSKCPICVQGMLNDAKTGKLRDCTICCGSGEVNNYK